MIYDLIGTLYHKTGNIITDEFGNEYEETEPVDGYHVNVLEITNELQQYVVDPQPDTMYRVFAGRESETVALKFADRNEWLALGIEEVPENILIDDEPE